MMLRQEMELSSMEDLCVMHKKNKQNKDNCLSCHSFLWLFRNNIFVYDVAECVCKLCDIVQLCTCLRLVYCCRIFFYPSLLIIEGRWSRDCCFSLPSSPNIYLTNQITADNSMFFCDWLTILRQGWRQVAVHFSVNSWTCVHIVYRFSWIKNVRKGRALFFFFFSSSF